MTHDEILTLFFARQDEEFLHDKWLHDQNFTFSATAVLQRMRDLSEISLVEFFNYMDNHPQSQKIDTRDIPAFGSLASCTDELCDALYALGPVGKTTTEIGQLGIYASHYRTANKTARARYGSQIAKTAGVLGLAFKDARLWYLSCFGYAYQTIDPRLRNRFLVRALLRSPFYGQILYRSRFSEVDVSDNMAALSPSTKGARSGSIIRLLQVGLDEMDAEGIKWYDIHVPGYNARSKKSTERVLPGTITAFDHHPLRDDYFEGGIPYFSVKAACGYFVDHEVPEQSGWLDVSGSGVRANSRDYFVVSAKGDSMLPKIKDGDLCLFKWYQGESIQNDIVLTQCQDYDSDYESSYTIKRFRHSEVEENRTVALEPLNRPKYKTIVLSEDDQCDYKVIGVFIKKL